MCSPSVLQQPKLVSKRRGFFSSGKAEEEDIPQVVYCLRRVQHTVGLADIGLAAAINKDPDAPIFNAAHCGIAGDCLEVLPQLTQKILETKKLTESQ
jgi:hypothetical protein